MFEATPLRGFIQQFCCRFVRTKPVLLVNKILISRQYSFVNKMAFCGNPQVPIWIGKKFQELGMGAGRNALTIEKVGVRQLFYCTFAYLYLFLEKSGITPKARSVFIRAGFGIQTSV